jgi:hypothetical protein
MYFMRALGANKSDRTGALRWENDSTSMIPNKCKPYAMTIPLKSSVKDVVVTHLFLRIDRSSMKAAVL